MQFKFIVPILLAASFVARSNRAVLQMHRIRLPQPRRCVLIFTFAISMERMCISTPDAMRALRRAQCWYSSRIRSKRRQTQRTLPSNLGIIAKLTVVAVASTSAVCEVKDNARDLVEGDVVTLPDTEVEKIVAKNTLGNTRQYPMVISFTEGDPLDEEVRETLPRPPLPEVNQIRGRIGFRREHDSPTRPGRRNVEFLRHGLPRDFTRIFGTHWNLNGYWRGNLRTSSAASQQTLQDLINRTYLMNLTYVNPDSHWTAGVGRLYIPWASSLEAIDGAYVGRQVWLPLRSLEYLPAPLPIQLRGTTIRSAESAAPSSTCTAGASRRSTIQARQELESRCSSGSSTGPSSLPRTTSHSSAISPCITQCRSTNPHRIPQLPAVNVGLGQSLLSLRVQVHPRVALDLTDTYFRDVPTYDPALVGTGLLDKYLYQGINGGARIQFPRHITGYFSLGSSSDSSDPKSSLNKTLRRHDVQHLEDRSDRRCALFQIRQLPSPPEPTAQSPFRGT